MSEIFVFSENLALVGELIALVHELEQTAIAIALSEAEARKISQFGADKVTVLKGESLRPEDYAGPISELLSKRQPLAFFVGATASGRELAARVAASRGVGLVNEALSVAIDEDTLQIRSLMYGGAVELEERLNGLCVVSIPAGSAEAVAAAEKTGDLEIIEVYVDQRVKRISSEDIVYSGTDITLAKRLVCVGMGLNNKEDLKVAEDLADSIQAELCCTRPISEDRGWMETATYIGLSGKVVKPDLLFEIGVSGQIQHTYGIRDAKIVASINNKTDAMVFSVSDYGIVGDLYELVPLLTEALKEA